MRVVLLAVLLLVGCASEAPVSQEDSLDLEDELRSTAETGVIRGVVFDAAIMPIAGVTVELTATGANTTTNDNGAFGFAGIEPGVHFMSASKPGFETVQAQAEVAAGIDDPPVIKIQMVPNPSTAPQVVPFYFQGHMGCSLSYIALCGLPVLSDVSEDSFLAEFPIERPPQWVNMESIWSGTQPTGNQMNLNMGGTPAAPATTCCTAQGPSPLLTFANETVLAEYDIGSGEDLVGRMFAWEMEGTGIDDHTGMCVPAVVTTYCQGPGMALDQDFELLVHAFYNWVPPEGWRFTADGEPVLPG